MDLQENRSIAIKFLFIQIGFAVANTCCLFVILSLVVFSAARPALHLTIAISVLLTAISNYTLRLSKRILKSKP